MCSLLAELTHRISFNQLYFVEGHTKLLYQIIIQYESMHFNQKVIALLLTENTMLLLYNENNVHVL